MEIEGVPQDCKRLKSSKVHFFGKGYWLMAWTCGFLFMVPVHCLHFKWRLQFADKAFLCSMLRLSLQQVCQCGGSCWAHASLICQFKFRLEGRVCPPPFAGRAECVHSSLPG